MATYGTLEDDPDLDASKERAQLYGYGVVKVSARRYVVVVHGGPGPGSGRMSDGQGGWHPWISRMNYLTLTKRLAHSEAIRVVDELDAAAREGWTTYKTLRDRLRDEMEESRA